MTVDVFVCIFDFYKDGSKSIHLSDLCIICSQIQEA